MTLFLDTSGAVFCMGLGGDTPIAWRQVAAPRGFAGMLLPALEELLAEAGVGIEAIDCMAVCVGPGSFTGLRVGVAFAQGLGLSRGIPVIPLASTDILLAGLLQPSLALIDARADRVWAAVPGGAPHATTLAPALELVHGHLRVTVVGSGAEAHRDEITQAIPGAEFAPTHRVDDIWRLVASRRGDAIAAEALRPNYCKPAQPDRGPGE